MQPSDLANISPPAAASARTTAGAAGAVAAPGGWQRPAAVRRSSPLLAPVSCHPTSSSCSCLFSVAAAAAARSAAAAADTADGTPRTKPFVKPATQRLAAAAATDATPCSIGGAPPAYHCSNGNCSCTSLCSSECSRPSRTVLRLLCHSRRLWLPCSGPPAHAATPTAPAAAPTPQVLSLLTQPQHKLQQQQPLQPAQQHRQQHDKEHNGRKQQQQELEDPLLLRAMRTHAFLHLTSGAVAGAVSRTATAPLDRLKVMLQLQPSPLPLRHVARVIMHQEATAKSATAGVTAAPASVVKGSRGSEPAAGRDRRQGQEMPQQQQQQQHRNRKATVPCSGSFSIKSSSSSNNRSLLRGWQGFFRGNLTNCLKVVPETAIKFYAYDLCKHALARRKQQHQLQQPQPQQMQQQPLQHQQVLFQQEPTLQLRERFVCGAAAGLCAQLLIYPMELVKTRLAAYSPSCMYNGVLQCFKAIYQEGGVRRLYRGLGPSLLGIVPYAGIDLAVFETLKEAYIERIALPRLQQQREEQEQRGGCSNCNGRQSVAARGLAASREAAAAGAGPAGPGAEQLSESMAVLAAPTPAGFVAASRCRCSCDRGGGNGPITPPALALLLMGGCSSLIGQVVAYPTALIRTRMQVDGSGGAQLQYRNSAAAAVVAFQQGGLRGLYRGLGANCCKALPAVSLSWIAYEKTKEAVRRAESFLTERTAERRNVAAPAAARS
ncbi:hypothetical protein Efla_004326 [Eimeria flavescens]